MTNFHGKSILVTGANSGIGEAAVAAFAAAGATTYGLARRRDALEAARAKHPKVRWLLADVAKADQLKAALAEVGPLDVLVNNAAFFAIAPLEASSEELMHTHFDTNVIGLVLATQAALPALLASKGAILNIGSAAGHKPAAGASIYAATKAAVESLTRSWAMELAPKGVRVNAIAPGPTETNVFAKLPMSIEVQTQIKAAFLAQVPLGRMASPAEIAHWIVAVADPASTWMTGEILRIDGGMSMT